MAILNALAVAADYRRLRTFSQPNHHPRRQRLEWDCGIDNNLSINLYGLLRELAAGFGSARSKSELQQQLRNANLQLSRRTRRAYQVCVSDVVSSRSSPSPSAETSAPSSHPRVRRSLAMKSRGDRPRQPLLHIHRMHFACSDVGPQRVHSDLLQVGQKDPVLPHQLVGNRTSACHTSRRTAR